MNTPLKRSLSIGGAFCLVALGVILVVIRSRNVSGAPQGGSPDVEVVQVEQKDVPILGEWIGTLDGLVDADVRAQVSGYILHQGYQEGAFVKKGELLFEIDPRPFQAAVDQAQGQLDQATATLANAEAVQRRTELDVNRYTPLAREQAASQQDLDNAIQNNLAAKATVETAKAQIQTAQAALETAKINLDFTRLVAPIDGIAGQAQLQVGALVNPNSGPVTSVSTIDPIKVYFTVSESEYLAWRRRFPTETTREAADKSLHLELILADGSTYPHPGTFYFADNKVNESTGAIRIAALFPNPGNISASRRLRQSPRGHTNPARCAARSTTCGIGTTRRLSSGGGGRAGQSQHTRRPGRRPCRHPVDCFRRLAIRGPGDCRRHAESTPGDARESKAFCRRDARRIAGCPSFSSTARSWPW